MSTVLSCSIKRISNPPVGMGYGRYCKDSTIKIVSRVKLLVGEKYWSGKNLVTKAKFSHFSPTFSPPIRYHVNRNHDNLPSTILRRQFTVVKFAVVKFAVVKFTVVKFTVVKFTVVKFTVVKFTVVKFTVVKFTVVKFAVVKFAVGKLSVNSPL